MKYKGIVIVKIRIDSGQFIILEMYVFFKLSYKLQNKLSHSK